MLIANREITLNDVRSLFDEFHEKRMNESKVLITRKFDLFIFYMGEGMIGLQRESVGENPISKSWIGFVGNEGEFDIVEFNEESISILDTEERDVAFSDFFKFSKFSSIINGDSYVRLKFERNCNVDNLKYYYHKSQTAAYNGHDIDILEKLIEQNIYYPNNKRIQTESGFKEMSDFKFKDYSIDELEGSQLKIELSKKYILFRFFSKKKDKSQSTHFDEVYRSFIDRKTKNISNFSRYSESRWYKLTSRNGTFNLVGDLSLNELSNLKGTHLEFFSNIDWEGISETTNVMNSIQAILGMPIILQMYESGFHNEFYSTIKKTNTAMGHSISRKSIMSIVAPGLKHNAKNFREATGLSRAQLRLVNEKKLRLSDVHKVRSLLGLFGDPKTINRDESESLIEFYTDVLESSDTNYILSENFNEETMLKVKSLVARLKYLYEEKEIEIKNIKEMVYYLNDSIRMLSDVDSVNLLTSKLKSYEDFEYFHNEMTGAYLVLLEEIETRQLKERMDKRRNGVEKRSKENQEFKYSNEKFSIVIPSGPEDIVNEGITLRHCVASYVDAVSKGRTSILFLRDNKELDKPLYTIELSNDRRLVQSRGVANRGLDDEAKDFLYEWMQEKEITI